VTLPEEFSPTKIQQNTFASAPESHAPSKTPSSGALLHIPLDSLWLDTLPRHYQ